MDFRTNTLFLNGPIQSLCNVCMLTIRAVTDKANSGGGGKGRYSERPVPGAGGGRAIEITSYRPKTGEMRNN